MKRKNRIQKIINEKFGLKAEPTRDTLQRLGMTPTRFNHIMDNKGSREMDAMEIKHMADWLGVEESDLWEDQETTDQVAKRHKIVV